jgi:ATP-dependent DNA helicase RecQ
MNYYIYIDLEVDQDEGVYRIGLVSDELELDIKAIETTQERLESFYKDGLHICGHNFRRFDYQYLVKSFPTLKDWLIVDTLELSVLAFPLERSQKLNKEYKLSEYAGNNPLEDALATRKLLEIILHAFSTKPQEILNLYAYLFSCGEDEASQAYLRFFGLELCALPNTNVLPTTAVEGIDTAYLDEFITQASTKPFNERLCMAGILAWNYESNLSKTKPPLGAWLSRLPDCSSILNRLKPINSPREFTYQPYLAEFGIAQFRGKQEEAIQNILAGQNPLILMATAAGKSLCYQLPALMLSQKHRGLTVIISPLQALMADQVSGLVEKGLDFATFINGNIRPEERRERLEQLRNGEKNLLYISAEQLRSSSVRALLEARPPSLIVFDEAHCISQWGHDFRPDYRYAPKFISELYEVQQREFPLMAFMTATATVAVRQDIKELFASHKILIHTEVCSSSKRDNLEYRIIPTTKQGKEQILIKEVQRALQLEGAVLVYTATRKNTERLAKLLNDCGIESRHYHGKIPKADKEEILQKFKNKELNVIVATCAFGMGIDRSDVRAVIHHTISGNLEAYVQEAGRAGRDGKPATCTLLFDTQDADTTFFLQSLNQLSEPELRNLFLTTRKLRDQIFPNASEDDFWVTTNEIFQSSDLDEEFAVDVEQRDTKIKVALHYLEVFGMIQRAENQSSFLQFELIHSIPEDSLKAFDLYAHSNNLPDYRRDEFHRLIMAMHVANAYCHNRDEPFPLERLSDASGIVLKELRQRVKELQRADVCTSKMPVKILITKGVKGGCRNKMRNRKVLEEQLCQKLIEQIDKLEDNHEIQINCRAIATSLDPDRDQKLTAGMILEILEGWNFLKWIKYKKVGHDVVRITEFAVPEQFDNYQNLISIIIDLFYRALGKETGKYLRLSQDLTETLSQINQITSPQVWELEDLEKALAWMHRHELIRLADGSNLFYQAMKVRVMRGARQDKVTREYTKEVKPHYEMQTRRTHVMLNYGEQSKQENFDPQEYIANYFTLPIKEFCDQYDINKDVAQRPVTQEDYDRIVNPLNPKQREIVLSDSPASAVIAGPGSGKTRTIVHRIAYLIKVKRVDPAKIIALAYNRNAVRELKLRLQDMIGSMASRLRVYTFHGLALAILGRTIEVQQNIGNPDQKFTQLIKDACKFLEHNEEDLEDEDNQVRISKLLGNCEYIFVDEYQDVAEHEYKLVELIAGLQVSEDGSRSVQTNICVIGDDDQNIYEWRGTSTQYIQSFQAEYQAKQFLLIENYRSTEPIIAAANRLIQNNSNRLKHRGDEQVRINNERKGQGGLDVQSLRFINADYQAEYIKRQVNKWIKNGVQPGDIAILARNWEHMDQARALLDRAGIRTYSLKGEDIKLTRNLITQILINDLEKNPDLILSKQESVKDHFEKFFNNLNRNSSEPTVKTLLKIAEDIDNERGYGAEDLSTPISVSEIITSIYEFNESPDVSIDPNAVLVTSCHGAKGLEFKYVILIADGFDYRMDKIESERRLFYVAMTRAKEKLILIHTKDSRFVQETGAIPYPTENIRSINPPRLVFYQDMLPRDIHLSFDRSRNQQESIKRLKEGDTIDLMPTQARDKWTIRYNNQVIGLLSNAAVRDLRQKGISPNQFNFQEGEVTVRSIYRHLKTEEMTGEIIEDWYVVIPQIRICRE